MRWQTRKTGEAVLRRLQNQYLLGSCCLELIWRKAFEVIAVFLLCGGSNHFYRPDISDRCKAAQCKQSGSISSTVTSPLWLICGQIRSHTHHTAFVPFDLYQYWLSERTGVKHDFNYTLPWWKSNFWWNSVSPNGSYFQLKRTGYWILF